MSVEGVEKLFYKTLEYVPGVGTLYALGRSLGYAYHGDAKEAILSALNLIQNGVRDAISYDFPEVIVNNEKRKAIITIMLTSLEGFTDESISQLFDAIHKKEQTKGKVKEIMQKHIEKIAEISVSKSVSKDEKPHFLLITNNEILKNKREQEDEFNKELNNDRNKQIITQLIHSHGAVYTGRINWYNYAENEPMVLVAPQGFGLGKTLYFYWQWTKDGSGNTKVLVNKYGTITHIDVEKIKSGELAFHFNDLSSNNYYKFAGHILLNNESEKNKLTLNMNSPQGANERIELQRQTTFGETS